MVKHVLCALVVLTSVAAAEEGDGAFNMLGFQVGLGALPIDKSDTKTLGLGLGVEHPVFAKTRVFGEYEWLWLDHIDPRAVSQTPSAPDHHGSGQRLSLGLRRELAGTGGGSVHVFIDGELGVGAALTNDNMAGVELLPDAFTGLRVGYDVYSRADDAPSRTFEIELLLRAIAIRDGIGMMLAVGMAWGN